MDAIVQIGWLYTKMRKKILLWMLVLVLTISSALAWSDEGASRCKSYNITNPNSISVTNQPVLIQVDYDNDMQADYDDLRFYTGSCSGSGTLMTAELENRNATRAIVWVLADLSSGLNTISLYYGNSSRTSGWNTNGAVWQNYVLVMHMNDTKDSTVYNATSTGTDITTVTGTVGFAQSFNGINSTMLLENLARYNLTGNDFTVEAWTYENDSNSENENIVSSYYDRSNSRWAWRLNNGFTNDDKFEVYNTTNSSTSASPSSTAATGNWIYRVGWYNMTSKVINYSRNESSRANNTLPGTMRQPATNASIVIGGISSLGWFNGTLDEIRVSNISRSNEYRAMTYANIQSYSTYIKANSEETQTSFYTGLDPANITWTPKYLTNTWQASQGLTGGFGGQMIWDIDWNAHNPNVGYFTTDTMHLWKTIDGFNNTFQIGQEIPVKGGISVVSDPNNENVVYVAADRVSTSTQTSSEQGIYKSINGGINWTFQKNFNYSRIDYDGSDNTKHGKLFLFDNNTWNGTETTTIYAGTPNGIWKTTNGGGTWTRITTINSETYDLEWANTAHTQIYVGTWGNLYKISSTGTIVLNYSGLGYPSYDIAVDDTNLNYAWVGTKYGIYKTTNGGTTWTNSSAYLSSTAKFINLARKGAYMYASPRSLGGNLPYYSINNGSTWNLASNIPSDEYLYRNYYFGQPIAIDPRSNGSIAITERDNDLSRTPDGGKTWNYTGNGFIGARILDVDFFSDNLWYLCLTDYGLFKTTDAGSTYSKSTFTGSGTDISCGSVDSTNSGDTIIASRGSWSSQDIIRSTNGGTTWTTVYDDSDEFDFIRFNPTNTSILYADNRISYDSGVTWSNISGSYTVAAIHPTNGSIIYGYRDLGSTIRIGYSTNNGATWTQIGSDITTTDMYEMDVDPHITSYHRVGFAGGYNGAYIYNGASWTLADTAEGLDIGGANYKSLRFDPLTSGVVWTAQEGYKYHGVGVYLSTNNGTSFTNVLNNLGPYNDVYGIRINPYSGDIFLDANGWYVARKTDAIKPQLVATSKDTVTQINVNAYTNELTNKTIQYGVCPTYTTTKVTFPTRSYENNLTLNSLAAGTYCFNVTAYDAWDNSISVLLNESVDSDIGSIVVVSRDEQGAIINWTQTSNPLFSYTTVTLNGVQMANITTNTYTFSGLTSGSNNTVTTQAHYTDGTTGTLHEETFTTVIALQQITLITPVNGENLTQDYNITWTQAIYEDATVTNQSITLTNADGTITTIAEYTTGTTYQWNISRLEYPAGYYTLEVLAYVGGNIISRDSAIVYVYNHVFAIYHGSYGLNSTKLTIGTCNFAENPTNFYDNNLSSFARGNGAGQGCALTFTLPWTTYNSSSFASVLGYSNSDGTKQNNVTINKTSFQIKVNLSTDASNTYLIEYYDGVQFGSVAKNAAASYLELYAYEAWATVYYTTSQELAINSITTVNGSRLTTATVYNLNTSNSTSGTLPLYLAMLNGTQTLVIETPGNWNKTINYESLGNETYDVTGIVNTYIFWNDTSNQQSTTSPDCYYDSGLTQYINESDNGYYLADGNYPMYCTKGIETYQYNITKVAGVPLNLTLSIPAIKVNIRFYDDETLTLLSGPLINLDLISDAFAENYSTTNGSISTNDLERDSYTLRYSSSGYTTRFHIININASENYVNLYLINSSRASNISVYVVDEVTNPVESATVKALRYDLASNTYILRESALTDINGKATLTLTKYDEFYKFIVEYRGETKKTTEPAYITTDSVNIQIDLQDEIGEQYFDYASIDYTLSYNNNTGNFRLDFNDVNGVSNNYTLKVYAGNNFSRTLVEEASLVASSGTILINIDPINGTTYYAFVSYYPQGIEKTLASQILEIPETLVMYTYGVFLQVLVTLASVFVALASTALACIVVPLSLILGRIIGLNSIGFASLIPMQVVGIIVAVIVSLKR